MFFSGISDEAGRDIDTQIQAHKDLGWTHMELRLIDGTNITSVTGAVFDEVAGKLDEAGMRVSCFGSAIANWARPITESPQADMDDLNAAVPRMRRLGTPFIRVMSYPNDPDQPLPEAEWKAESIKRMKQLARVAEDGGVTLVHENCSGWGGQSAENSNELLQAVDSPALKVVFDTGNPVTYRQDPWAYYQAVKDDIAYVHIKDAKVEGGEDVYTYPGEGQGCVREVIRDLLRTGYDGGVSIEPHLAAVIHTGERTEDASRLYESYVEYGRRLMRLVDEERA
jgi:sugar phosphate isomerase/epimerase